MTIIGETKPAKELGYKGHSRTVIWAACELCGKERWVQAINGEPQWLHCRECGRNLRKHNHPRIVTNEQLHPLTKRCNKCGIVYPATGEYFNKNKRCYSGLVSPCKKCHNKRTRERLHKQGKTKLDKAAYLKEFEVKRELANKRFNSPMA